MITVAHNCHIKNKFPTSKSNLLHQTQIRHNKSKIVTSKTNSPHRSQTYHIKHKFATTKAKSSLQKQIHHIKNELVTSKTNFSQQKQIPHIKIENFLTLKSKTPIKRSAVNERKLSPVFTRPSPDRHFVLAHGTVVLLRMYCSNCGRSVENCNFCANCGKGKSLW